MRFRFLGTGTSSGVPAIACDCAVCTSSDPRDQRLRTGAVVEFTDVRGRERVILIDATPDLRQQALSAGLRRCDAIVFTHNHVDHVFGLDEVRRFNAVQRSPIEVYAELHTMESLRRVYQHIFDVERNVNDSFVATLIPHLIEPGRTLDLFGMNFMPIRLLHGKLPIVGFRIEPSASLDRVTRGLEQRSAEDAETDSSAHKRAGMWADEGSGGAAPERPAQGGPAAPGAMPPSAGERKPSPFPLAYCTDVSAVPPETWRHLSGVQTLVLDALRHRKHPTHMTLEEAVNVADRVSAKETYFVHMSHDLPHEETNAALPEGMRLAYDGLTLG